MDGKLKLETITGPLTVPEEQVEKVSLQLGVLSRNLTRIFSVPPIKGKSALLLPLETGSPVYRSSLLG